MADKGAEARIRDLKKRLELDPGSRLFVALAEEYRKSQRHAEALSTLQKGLLAHPNYLSAQVALGRAYLEAGQITEAIATFSKTLAADPGNLVAARSLADIYLSRGESVEAIKKYKLYRALSGDRRVDEIIQKLEIELAPPPPPPSSTTAEVPPPPTFFDSGRAGAPRKSRDLSPPAAAAVPPPNREEPLEIASVPFEPDESAPRRASDVAMPGFVSRDTPLLGVSAAATTLPAKPEAVPPSPPSEAPKAEALLPSPPPEAPPTVEAMPPSPAVQAAKPETILPPAAVAAAERIPPPPSSLAPPAPEPAPEHPIDLETEASPPEPPTAPFPEPADLATRAFRISEILGTPSEAEESSRREAARRDTAQGPEPRGRVLADLYYAQGHYAEALRIYDDLVAANPDDAELKRLRRDAEARLLPAATTSGAAAPDPALARRLAKIRVLKRWLGMVQTG